MFWYPIINTNTRGIPYIRTNGVTVGTDAVEFALGFRSIAPFGDITINIADAIPEGTTGTLPVRFTLNGNTRTLTYFGGEAVTAADITGTGRIKVFHDYYDGSLQLMSPLAPAGA